MMIAIFLFYKKSTGIQASLAFSKVFRHCNIIIFDGFDWVSYELDSYGIHTRVLHIKEATALLRGLKIINYLIATVTIFVKNRARIVWKPFWVRSCNEFDRYLSGVDIGFTFNPRHLYSKLFKHDGKRNYEILAHWRRN